MQLSQSERRLFQAHEDAREAAEIGPACSDVECAACGTDCDQGAVVVLRGLTYDPDCAMDEALRLRTDPSGWEELSRHDQAEALEVLETGAHLERAALVRRRS